MIFGEILSFIAVMLIFLKHGIAMIDSTKNLYISLKVVFSVTSKLWKKKLCSHVNIFETWNCDD